MSATTPNPQEPVPGRIMSGEMAEQPAVLRRILEQGAPPIREIAEQMAARNPRFVLLRADRYRFAERLVLTSRGYGYPTAKEAALKLIETRSTTSRR
ncbi:hypothetical protein ACPEIC_44100 [Stenotrophomonas sp. NPDC087984]